MILGIFNKGYRYVLKGRNPKGEWEDLEEYDKPVKTSEIADLLYEYRDKGYDSFRLDCYDKNGKYVKRLWVRNFPKRTRVDDLSLAFDQLIKIEEVKKKLKEALGIKEYDPEDIIANIIYWEEMKKKLSEIASSSSGLGELGEILKIIKELQGLGVGVSTQSIHQPSTTANVNQPATTQLSTPVIVETPVADQLVNDIMTKVNEKLKEITTPPCDKGECEE
jgi:hypothetical protein